MKTSYSHRSGHVIACDIIYESCDICFTDDHKVNEVTIFSPTKKFVEFFWHS